MNQIPISILIPVKNAEKTLEKALESASFAREIIVLDDNSVDNSVAITKRYTDAIITDTAHTFAQKRNALLTQAHCDWVFYLDADEVITPELKEEIIKTITSNRKGAYFITRDNFFLGRKMYTDKLERLFHTSTLKAWEGSLHEHPILTENSVRGDLANHLIHNTHRSMTSMLLKTNEWSEIEADLRVSAQHPPMAGWRLWRIGLTVFAAEYFGKKLYRFGREGLFEAYFQMIDKLIVYTKLWERQHGTDQIKTN